MNIGEIEINDFSGGLDNVSPLARVKNNASPDCANFLFNRDKSIRKRLGYKRACDTTQTVSIVKIHDFVDRAGVERKIVVLSDGTVKTLSGTATLDAFTVNGDAITLPASTFVDMNSTYLGANDVVVATSGGIPRKIANNNINFLQIDTSKFLVYSLEYVSDTKIYVAGSYPDSYVYMWNGNSYEKIGNTQFLAIYFIKWVSDTEIYCGDNEGFFKYDGSSWSELGSLLNVRSMAYVNSTNIYATGSTISPNSKGIYNWNGSAWSQIGTDTVGVPYDLYYISANDIYISDSDVGNGGNLFHWNGSNISEIGDISGGKDIYKIHFVSTNAIYVGSTNGFHKWNGSSWSKLSDTLDTNCMFFKYVNANEIYCIFQGSNKFRKYNATSWSDITNNNFVQLYSISDRFYIVNPGKIFFISYYHGLIEFAGFSYAKIFALRYYISGTVASTSPSKITVTDGTTDNIHAGDYLNHASITEGIYVTGKSATEIFTSVNLTAGTYTDIAISQAPKAYFNEVYNNLMMLGNIEYANVKYPSQIAISNLDDKEDFYGTSGLLNVLEFGTGEGDGITAIKSLNGRLVVWKRYSVFSLTMTDPEEAATVYRQRISDKGTIAAGSVQRIPLPQGITAAIYINDEGFYLTDGSQCWQTPAMKNVWYDFNVSYASGITSAWDEDNDMYYVAFPTGSSTTNNVILAYSPFIDAFIPIEYNNTSTPSTFSVTAFGIFNRDLYHAEKNATTTSYLYIDNQDTGDAAANDGTGGRAITYQWKTPMLSIDVPRMLKEWREINVEYRVKAADPVAPGTPTTTLTVNLYKSNNTSPETTGTTVANLNTTEQQISSRFRFSVKDRYCTVEITGGTAKDMFELHRLILKYKTIGVR